MFQFIQAHAKNLFILADGRLGGGSVPIEIQKHGRVLTTTQDDEADADTDGDAPDVPRFKHSCDTPDGSCSPPPLSTVGEAEIRAWFSANGLDRWVDIFIGMGVENVGDLKFVTVDDMNAMGMPLIQQRKFSAAFASFAAIEAAVARDPTKADVIEQVRQLSGKSKVAATHGSNKNSKHSTKGRLSSVEGRKLQENRRKHWQKRKTSATLI